MKKFIKGYRGTVKTKVIESDLRELRSAFVHLCIDLGFKPKEIDRMFAEMLDGDLDETLDENRLDRFCGKKGTLEEIVRKVFLR